MKMAFCRKANYLKEILKQKRSGHTWVGKTYGEESTRLGIPLPGDLKLPVNRRSLIFVHLKNKIYP
jgi:hypothetical protein